MTIIHDAIARISIHRQYTRLSTEAGECNRRLYTTGDPAARAELLERYAATEAAMADLHPIAFGADPNPDENGRDVAESLASSTELLRLLAATERVLTTPAPDWQELDDLLVKVPDLEAHGWKTLALIRDRAARADYIGHLADLAAERVGGQAAETLYCLTYTEHELAAAAAEGRAPTAPWSPPRWAIATIGLSIAALLAFPVIPGLKTIPGGLLLVIWLSTVALLAGLGRWTVVRQGRPAAGGEGQEVMPTQ